jgi:VWFA-related protein
MGLFRARLLSYAIACCCAAGVLEAAAIRGETPGDSVPATAEDSRDPVTVSFVEPQGLIQGVTRITVNAATTPPALITQVAIYVDDALLTILETPPYTLTWNAGTRFHRKILRAVATDSDGRTGQAVLVTRPLLIGQYEEVRLVNLYAIVRDRKNRPVLDLQQDDFMLYEDGIPQTVSHFTSARVPLTVALLIDASNSMNRSGKLRLARKAAVDFARAVNPDDQLLVLHFNDRLLGSTDPVSDRRQVEDSIEAIDAEGGTALYDAIYRTSNLLAGHEGRRAIVLLSDGRDQALTENEPGSLHLFEEALEKAHRSEAAIYAVGLGRRLDEELDLQRRRSLKDILETFARETGGRAYFPERAGQLSGIYKEIASDLKQQYGLGYTTSNSERDGRWRDITLKVRDPEMHVQARSGYYAPGPGLP